MNGYLLLGYTVSLTLLWGYAFLLLLESRAVRKREKQSSLAHDYTIGQDTPVEKGLINAP